MSAPNCLRRLVRPPTSSVPRRAAPFAVPILSPKTAPFSTTTPTNGASKDNKKIKNTPDQPRANFREGKKMKLGKFKKSKTIEKGKPPLPGERKAYRKRITLSNDNALRVPWVTDMGPADLADAANIAKILSLPEQVQDQLRASEAFKPTQCWGMFRKPSMLVRTETVDLMSRMQSSADNKRTLRLVVTGDRLTGKSTLLLQAMAHAFANGWIVIHVPEAQDLTTACTEYAPIPNTDPVQYMQPVYILKLIQAFRKANEKVLARTTTVSGHHEVSQNIPVHSPLLTLANAARDAETAWPVFTALWKELTAPAAGRPPVLITMDGLAHMMKISDYRSPAFELIHSHDLAFVRMLTDALGGAVQFPGGGAVLAATSRNNAPRTPSMELALAQREAEQQLRAAATQAGSEEEAAAAQIQVPQKDPFFRGYDERVDAVLKAVEVLRLKGVSKLEARALMEYWAASGMLRAAVDEKTVTEKWALAGSGVLGELERASLLSMRI